MASESQRRSRVIAVVSVITGLLLIGMGIADLMLTTGPEWEKTDGTVLSGEVEHRFRPAARPREMNEYWPIVRYEFRVLGQRYEADRITAGMNTDFYYVRDFAALTLQEYPVGSEVQVFYDPDDPGNAALKVEPGAGGILLVLGAVVMVGGVFLSFRMRGIR